MLNCFIRSLGQQPDGGSIFGAWSSEDPERKGWTRVKVVMDSGAAECVCPPDMAPQFAVVDSPASRAGVYYSSACGGRMANKGQQHVPIAFGNGIRAITLQVADVSRLFMSVVCEMVNRVLFGAAAGVIMNFQSIATPIIMEEGVYVFRDLELALF